MGPGPGYAGRRFNGRTFVSPSVPPSPAQTLTRLLGGGRAFSPLGVLALVVLGFTVLVVALSVWPLLRVRHQARQPIPEVRSDESLFKDFRSAVGRDLAQVEGRSLFAIPGPPAPVEVVETHDTTKATRYGGPSVIAMVNGQVWFSDGQRLGPGDSGTGSLKVLALDAPWSAKVEWQGGEFDVEFFQRSPLLTGQPMAESTVEPAAYVPPALRRRGGSRGSRPGSPAPATTTALGTPPPRPAAGPGGPPDGPDAAPPPPMPRSDEPGPEPAADPGTAPDQPRPAPPPSAEPGSDPHPDPQTEPAPSPAAPPEPEPENAHK